MGCVKFAVDANETPVAVVVWNTIYKPHKFIHIRDLALHTVPDVELYKELVRRNFDALITRDRRQLTRPEEIDALRASGLNWIGHPEPSGQGLTSISQIVASYCSALPHIIKLLENSDQKMKIEVKRTHNQATQAIKAWDLHNYTPISI